MVTYTNNDHAVIFASVLNALLIRDGRTGTPTIELIKEATAITKAAVDSLTQNF